MYRHKTSGRTDGGWGGRRAFREFTVKAFFDVQSISVLCRAEIKKKEKKREKGENKKKKEKGQKKGEK